jgi:hypothetical protein
MNPQDILRTIELSGSADEEIAEIKQLINTNLDNVLDYSAGRLRLKRRIADKFQLIISNPISSAVAAQEIRCLHCRRIISYPAWWLKIEYVKNVMHYFVCFSVSSPTKVSLDCR